MTRDEVIREMAAANQATRFDFRGCPTSVEHESLPEAAMRSALARAEELGWHLISTENDWAFMAVITEWPVKKRQAFYRAVRELMKDQEDGK